MIITTLWGIQYSTEVCRLEPNIDNTPLLIDPIYTESVYVHLKIAAAVELQRRSSTGIQLAYLVHIELPLEHNYPDHGTLSKMFFSETLHKS